MKSLLDRYLDRVLLVANKTGPEAESIRLELRDHLLQKTDDLLAAGVPREEATLEALRRHGSPRDIGYRLRGPFPWIDIRAKGTARGVIAIGPKAVGIVAVGGWALGVFAFGGLACGLVSVGGFALGLLFVFAGLGIGGITYGGYMIGVVALGGYAVGIVAQGGEAIGLWVPHADHAISHYTAANVPPFLKGLARFMQIPQLLDRFPQIVWPLYGLGIFLMGMLLSREGRRIASEEDWIVGE
ncbi:MAG: permease prefix domain 1-containing protein [Verrucomicrobiota bacterium]